jgi:hypothetical protein
MLVTVPPLPRVANLAQAAAALDARRAMLVASEATLLASASEALDCAEKATAGKADLIATARADFAAATKLRTEIDRIEACWVPA